MASPPTNSKLAWFSGFETEQLGNVLLNWYNEKVKALLQEAGMSQHVLDASRCTPGEFAKSLCVEFDSDTACRQAIRLIRDADDALTFKCPMAGCDVAIRVRPDKTLPMRLKGRAISAV